jgi:anti-anti-sigma factor
MSGPAFSAEAREPEGIPEAREIRIRGRVTYHEAPELRRAILEQIETSGATRMILELGGIEKMDTSGAAVLAEALKTGEGKGMRVLLCGAGESVLRIFRLAGFEDVLDRCCTGWDETRRRLEE